MPNLFPYLVRPDDALAITAVLEMLLANEEPPRVDVTRVRSDWLNRPPYPNGRLLVRGGTRSGPGGEPSGFVVWYCCARYGRPVPVREWAMSVGEGTPILRDAPYDELSCLGNPPWRPNDSQDGWRETYDTALAALTP